MDLRILSTIFILTMATSIAAVGQTNFTEACEVTRHEMIAGNPLLENETRLQCGQQYSPLIPPALPISTDLSTCLQKWPEWQISTLTQWTGPLVGFLLPALIFVLSIPRAPKFRMPRGERHFDRNIFLSFGWLVLIFFLMALEVLLWIIIVFSLAGPMMAGAMDEGIKDLRILRMVTKGNLEPPQKRYALALTMIGTFEPSPGKLAEKVITDICDAPTATEAQDKLHQLLNRQGLYGIQVGAAVVFYLGAYAYALFDASSKLGDNDTAHVSDLARCNARCTHQVVLPVFEPLLFRGVGYRQQPIHVS